MTFIPSAKLAMVLISGHSSRVEPKEVIAPITTDMNLSVSSLQFHLQSLEEELHCHAYVYLLSLELPVLCPSQIQIVDVHICSV